MKISKKETPTIYRLLDTLRWKFGDCEKSAEITITRDEYEAIKKELAKEHS